MSKRFLSITLAALTLCFFASSCVKEDGFENRVREIVGTGGEETRIATVEEQVKGMQNTITQLQSAQTALEQRADQLRSELTTAQGDITTLEEELDEVNKTIASIQESIASLEAGIAELRQYVRDTIATVTGWVTATFATIEKTKEVDSILAASIDTVRLKYPKDISDSLKKAVAGIQTWVNGKLTGYWTIAQTQARLDSLGEIEKKDSATLAESIEQAKTDLTTEYQAAIKTAIDSLGGALNDTINNRIARASATLNTRIEGINTKLAALEATVKNLLARIQGIEVVPEYQDGSVGIKKNSTVTVSFEVRPASLADSIVKKKGAGAFILQAVETKAVTKAVTYYNLTVTNPKVGTDSLLTLTVGKGALPTTFFDGSKPFNARLRISDGNTDKPSAYFPLANVYSFDQDTVSVEKKGSSTVTLQFGSVSVKDAQISDFSFSGTTTGVSVTGVTTEGVVTVAAQATATATNARLQYKKNGTGAVLAEAVVELTEWVPKYPGGPKGVKAFKIGKIWWAPVNCGYSDTTTYGLLYQFGRKVGTSYGTPWIQPSAHSAEANPQTLSTNPATTNDPEDRLYYSGDGSYHDWYSGSPKLPAWPMKSGDTGYKADKIDNPCPDGWRVPTIDELTELLGGNYHPARVVVGEQRGVYFNGTPNPGNTGVFLPCAGIRKWDVQDKYRGNDGYYWSSSIKSTAGRCLSFDSSYASAGGQNDRSFGQSVRCVQDVEE